MIELNTLEKSYAGHSVLDIGNFCFESGLRYAILGPNGCGKTTLLRIISGALKPDNGTVHMPQAMRQSLGYMPQRPYAFGFSVLKNVQLAFAKQKNTQAAALDALKKVGMESHATHKGNRLSGGEAQRMAIAQMIALPRRLLLLDEPTSCADIAGNIQIESALAEYCKINICTLIFVTHSPAQAQRLAQHTLMMDNGKIVETGPTQQLLHHAECETTQNFMRHWQLK